MEDVLLLRAIELAKTRSQDGQCGPFGAVLARREELISEGWNQVVSNSDPTAHAEIVAIRSACLTLGTHVLSGCQIYCSCEPCPMCLAAIYWSRIDSVYYACSSEDATAAGFDDEKILSQLRVGWDFRNLKVKQSMRREGQKAFEAWLQNPKRRDY